MTALIDIIDGVMRAAHPKAYAEAARRLGEAAPTASRSAAPVRFSENTRPATHAPRPLTTSSAMTQFEAFVLQCFIEPMLPSADGVYGGGTAGGFWKSMLAEKLAVEMAKGGGIGIAARLIKSEAAKASAAPGPQNPRS